MSASLLGLGFRADMGTCIRKLVLLKLVDACEEDGTRIFPAIATVARAAQCSERQVQRELRAFLDAGLLKLVKEGGKGPRSTNEYALDLDMLMRLAKAGWNAVVGKDDADGPGLQPADAEQDIKVGGPIVPPEKGDTESPLGQPEKGDTGDPKRVTPATPKGDTWSHPTPPYPSSDPSMRESAREAEDREDPKAVERSFERAFRAWPTSITDSRPAALKAWEALTPAERERAAAEAGRYLEAAKAVGRKHVCSHAVYLAEKRWEGLGPAERAQAARDADAPAFGPGWAFVRWREIATKPPEPGPKPSAFIAARLAKDDAEGLSERLRRQAFFGWPVANRLDEGAASGRGIRVPPELDARAKALTEPVPVGSAVWEAWRQAAVLHGWPWLPDPGGMRVVFFPRGGPEGIEAFRQALATDRRESGDDGGGQEAA